MVQEIPSSTETSPIKYPDSDGQPMADNTLQFQWIVTIKENLELLFAPDPNVFVAGDLLWYPVEGNNKIRRAPDAMVVFGRPKGYRGSYQQWREDNIPPQVVFAIFSPGNSFLEMELKRRFYEQYGVEEYYLYHPQNNDLTGWVISENKLEVVESINGWVSPRLGIRFELTEMTLKIFRPDGEPFVSFQELDERRREAEKLRQIAEEQKQIAENKFESEQKMRQAAEDKLKKLQDKMREMGLELEE
ncbi:Uma2 family endonuclease [[Limnothrix rosea] IAM M-220]|uniref:Uma2 family endonuclease n=1 Tax=[Limnothrix rosea] IAM M-220 TaxID=454133 RepID=UPI00095FFBC3|nr:Uma2 family endonuclease [[Limnothrix rosea] IAM M-220]OKH17129.1 hypothetical protein NIES208_10620 [[Limnothrix rosea] IAM M-220]